MDRAVLSLLWLSLCAGMEAAGGPTSGPPRRTDGGGSGVGRKAHPVVLHDYMVFLYRRLSRLHRRDDDVLGAADLANTVTGFVDQGKDPPSRERGQRYIFDLSSLSGTSGLVQAELRILRKQSVDAAVLTAAGNRFTVCLHACSPEARLLDCRSVEVLDGSLPRWEVFDVTSGVRNSTGQPAQACFHLRASSERTGEAADPLLLGLARRARRPREKALLVAASHADPADGLFRELTKKMETGGGGFRPHEPFQPEDEKRDRRQRVLSKRSFGGAGGGAGAGGTRGTVGRSRARCSRKALHVNFKDLGWDDWIIAPLDYEARRCDGVCDFPLRSHLDPTNHAVIQTLMNSVDPGVSPPSCCVPSRLSPVSILYVDAGNNVAYRRYEDMAVESCGCR